MNEQPVHMDEDLQLKTAEHVARLVTSYIRQTLSPERHDQLDDWVAAQESNLQLFEDLTDDKKLGKELELLEEADMREVLKKCKRKLFR